MEYVGIDLPNYTHATKMFRFTVTDPTRVIRQICRNQKTTENSSTSCT